MREWLTLATATAIAHAVRTRSKTHRRSQSAIGVLKALGWIEIAKRYTAVLQDIVRQVCVWDTVEILATIAGRD